IWLEPGNVAGCAKCVGNSAHSSARYAREKVGEAFLPVPGRRQTRTSVLLVTLEYAGINTDGKGLKVSIQGDKVSINGVERGNLLPGDSVQISDDGVAVNSLDYGESEKYLRANSSSADAAALN